MSTLKVNAIRQTAASSDAITLASDGTCTAKITNNLSNRNLIINGSQIIAERGSVSAVANAYGACDRWRLFSNGTSARFDTTQSTDVPSGSGFSNSLKLDCSTADTSLGSGDYYMLIQKIEGLNLQHLKYGTSSAEKCTLSFWVKSPKTGVHNLEIESADGGKFNTTQYSISSANSWQKVEITFDGYQTTAIANDNTVGLYITFWLQAGSAFTGGSYSANSWHSTNGNRAVNQVNVLDSTSNDFYITGVQLEVGDVATDFEHRSYGDELARCQRYFWKSFPDGIAPAKNLGNTDSIFSQVVTGYNGSVIIPISMRTDPTLVFYNPSADNSNNSSSGATATNRSTSNGIFVEWGSVAGNFYTQITASAEL